MSLGSWQKGRSTYTMKKGHRFAAIDIGSNAVRLLLSAVFETDDGPFFRKISLIRMPVRLGEDVFIQNRISDRRIDELVKSMIGFKHLMEAYRPIDFQAYATSAMREAENRSGVCEQVEVQSGIGIDVIDGKKEAEIIFSNGSNYHSGLDKGRIYVDVGGGSTEITLFHDGHQVSKSFNIGTIRVMRDLVNSSDWNQMKLWVQDQTARLNGLDAIGSGGNIHKILRLAKTRDYLTISLKQMKKVGKLLKACTPAERITKLGLKPDRADVILPALRIYHSVLKWGGIQSISVPQMGLADGIVRQLYHRYRNNRTSS